jgi:hypothetical protein
MLAVKRSATRASLLGLRDAEPCINNDCCDRGQYVHTARLARLTRSAPTPQRQANSFQPFKNIPQSTSFRNQNLRIILNLMNLFLLRRHSMPVSRDSIGLLVRVPVVQKWGSGNNADSPHHSAECSVLFFTPKNHNDGLGRCSE